MRPKALLAALLLAGCGQAEPGNTETSVIVDKVSYATVPVLLRAADGVTVYGTRYQARRPRALILLFHQAGSGKDEYATIAPRLAAAGYDSLAIDQRAGGGEFGPNQTVVALGHAADYLDARPDLQAALDWAVTQKLPVIVWGSSYSSSLVFGLAADNPGKVKAVLAFSPAEYFDDPGIVRRWAAKVTVPVFVTSAPDAGEVSKANAIFDAVAATDKTDYVPASGVHASSTLIAAKNPEGAEANWQNVLGFLARVLA